MTKMGKKQIIPVTKTVLDLLVKGVFISSLFVFPGAAPGVAAVYGLYEKLRKDKDLEVLSSLDTRRLKSILKRLHQGKSIEVIEENGSSVVRLTEKGRLKVFRYKLEEMSIKKPKQWDRKWRLIIYDISKFKKSRQEAFRRMIKKINLLPIQKSVYLSPYPCSDEIEFLRQYFDLGEEVIYVIASKIENDEAYRAYFRI